jgi:hypothetical protein
MKSKYLEDLSKLLDDYQMDQFEKQDIINDYAEMYDAWIDKGFNEEEAEKKLGHPRSIIRDLTEGHKKVERPLPGSEKVIALSPFIATISFLILGFGFDLWHPGWMVFLLIPVTAIIMSMGKTKEEHLSTALSPFFATVIFLLLGFLYDLWHPAWMVFLIIPVLGIWNSRYTMRKIDLLTALSPFIAVVAFIILGLNGYWIEGWVVFLIIPMFGIFNYPNKKVMMFWELLLIGGVAGYLFLGLVLDISWEYAWLTFIPFAIFSLYKSDWEIDGEVPRRYLTVIVFSIIAFLATGYFLNVWAVSWLFFLAIPVYAIISEVGEKEKLVALSPFIALSLFMLIGYFFNLWHLSWMAFLIIPMTAIVKNA